MTVERGKIKDVKEKRGTEDDGEGGRKKIGKKWEKKKREGKNDY